MIRLFAALASPPEIGEALVRAPARPGRRALAAAGELCTSPCAFRRDRRDHGRRPGRRAWPRAARGPVDAGAGRRRRLRRWRRRCMRVWAGVARKRRCAQLARRCEMAARRAGLKPDTPRLASAPDPGLSDAAREPAAVAAWIQANNLLRSPPFRVGAFGLYSSRLAARRLPLSAGATLPAAPAAESRGTRSALKTSERSRFAPDQGRRHARRQGHPAPDLAPVLRGDVGGGLPLLAEPLGRSCRRWSPRAIWASSCSSCCPASSSATSIWTRVAGRAVPLWRLPLGAAGADLSAASGHPGRHRR